MGDNTLGPRNSTTRAQLAIVLQRYIEEYTE